MSDHAKLSPSASHRWMVCPGSIRSSEGMPEQESSDYANEGTAAHEVGERCLRTGRSPKNFLGEKINVEGKDYLVDAEMVEAVSLYVAECNKRLANPPVKFIEQKFHLDIIHPDIYGTSDFGSLIYEDKILHVVDLKYGKGIVVDPDWNTQLMIYGLGVLIHIASEGLQTMDQLRGYEVELTIVQPRAYHTDGPVRSWRISAKKLMEWGFIALKTAAIMTEELDASLVAGHHCRFCPAIAVCPEQRREAFELAKLDFSDDTHRLPAVEDLTPVELRKVMELSGMIAAWRDSVEAYIHHLLESGKEIEGLKLVEKRATRKWIDEEKAEKKLSKLLGEEAYTRKLKTVAQAEKLIKAEGGDPDEVMNGLWSKESSGTTVVSADDKRPPAKLSAAMDFAEEVDLLS